MPVRNPGINQPTSSAGKKYRKKKAAVVDHDYGQSLAAAAVAAGAPIQWHDLPLKLVISLISSEEGTLLEAVSAGGVTKSWRRSQPNKCHSKSNPLSPPQLQLFPVDQFTHEASARPVSAYTFGVRNKRDQVRWLVRKDGPFHRAKPQLVGFSKGMVLATGRIPDRLRYYLLLTPESECGHSYGGGLPFWEWDDAAKFSYHRPSHRHSIEDAVVIVLTGVALPAFACYKSGKQFPHAWKKQDSPIVDPNGYGEDDDRFMRLCSGVWLRGKLYAQSLQGTLVVIQQEGTSGDFRVGSPGKQRMVPSVPCKRFREILVESEGQILLVFLLFRKSGDSVEVYRLDIGKLEWIRLLDLGDRVLFFGSNCGVSVSVAEADRLGCRRNCVYFKHTYWAGWSEYDMAVGTIRISHLT